MSAVNYSLHVDIACLQLEITAIRKKCDEALAQIAADRERIVELERCLAWSMFYIGVTAMRCPPEYFTVWTVKFKGGDIHLELTPAAAREAEDRWGALKKAGAA